MRALVPIVLIARIALAAPAPDPLSCRGVVAKVEAEGSNRFLVFADEAEGACTGRFAMTAGAVGELQALDVRPGETVQLRRSAQNSTEATKLTLLRATFAVRAVVDSVDAEAGSVSFVSVEPASPGAKIRLALVRRDEPMRIPLADQSMKEELGKLAKGDRVQARLLYTFDGSASVSAELVRPRSMKTETLNSWIRFLLLAVPAVGLSLLTSLISKFRATRVFFIGEDNRTSNSKTQGSIWLIVILSVFLAVFILRLTRGDWLFGSIAMPVNLGLLAGISGLSFVGAKAITVSKEEKSKASSAPAKTTAAEPELGHLIADDKKDPNFGDFQMIMVTIVAVIVYLMQVWNFLGTMELTAATSLPDIDGSLTTLFGISQASYLGNKAAGKPGQ
jgi:hypothetical protein